VELRLGTFNVWGLPKPFAGDLSARTRAIARRLPDQDLDVLLIQEAWTDVMRDSLRSAALEAGSVTPSAFQKASFSVRRATRRWFSKVVMGPSA